MYAGHVHSSTLRAEMTRLRTLLGPDVLASRPYRLVVDTESDWGSVGAHLAAGRVRDALQAYKGPLLPGSEAPVVVARCATCSKVGCAVPCWPRASPT